MRDADEAVGAAERADAARSRAERVRGQPGVALDQVDERIRAQILPLLEQAARAEEDVDELRGRLDRLDAASRRGPWTRTFLAQLAEQEVNLLAFNIVPMGPENTQLTIFPEIHSEYGAKIHEEISQEGYPIYDFFFPGLVIDALDRGTNRHLLRWIRELIEKNIKTVNMLGCHDGIPVLDLRGAEKDGVSRAGLLSDEEIDTVIDEIMDRGGRVKSLYGPDGKKISYY